MPNAITRLLARPQHVLPRYPSSLDPPPDENLSNADPLIQEKAVAAFPNFLAEYLRDGDDLIVARRDKIVDDYCRDMDNSELHRRGIALALGERSGF